MAVDRAVVEIVYPRRYAWLFRGLSGLLSGRPGRAFLLKRLVRPFPELNRVCLEVNGIEIPLDLRLDADIGYFYDEGIGHERFYQEVLMAMVDQDTVFYDIGANLGYYSFLLSSRVKWICSIEPNPHMAERLRGVVDRHSIRHMEILSIGVADHAGRLEYHYQPGRHNLGSFVSASTNDLSIQVDVNTLDDLLASGQRPRPTLLKIDTEGYELNILKGYGDLLSDKPVVMMEWIPGRDDQPSNWNALLDFAGDAYDVFKVGHIQALVTADERSFSDYSNLLLLPKGSDERQRIAKWIRG